MIGIFLKVLADILSARNDLRVKEMLSQRGSDRRLHLLSVAVVSIPLAGIGVFYWVTNTSIFHIGIALLGGIAYISAGHFYYRATSVAQPSRLSLIFRAGSILTPIFSAILLHENLTVVQYIGCGLSFAIGVILTIGQTGDTLRLDRGIRDALLCNVFSSLNMTLSAYLLRHYSPWQTFTMTRIGVIIGILAILGMKETWKMCQAMGELGWADKGRLLEEQISRLLSGLLCTTAIARVGSATMVAMLSGFAPFYVWIIAILKGHKTISNHELRKRLLACVVFLGTSYLMVK